MNIKPFAVEEWMNAYENDAIYNIAETCVDSVSLNELFELTGENKENFLNSFLEKRLTYGYIEGKPELKQGIASLYKTLNTDEIITTHGATGANHHVFYSLVNPGDKVISIMPTYQQLYSIPESFKAKVEIVELKKENGYLPDIEEIRRLATPDTKLICINNPNNPTGALMSTKYLKEIVEIAKTIDAWVMCDEVYRHLTQDDEWSVSIVDLYEKGISTGSMSKVFSLAGLRLGWIATHDKDVIKTCLSHRDYNLISCGMFDEAIGALALKHADKLLKRNKTIVRENLSVLDTWVKQEKHISYVKPKAGTTALLYYDLDIPSVEFCDELMKDSGTLLTPGSCFEVEHSLRIGYACEKEDLIKGLQKLSEYMEKKSCQN